MVSGIEPSSDMLTKDIELLHLSREVNNNNKIYIDTEELGMQELEISNGSRRSKMITMGTARGRDLR